MIGRWFRCVVDRIATLVRYLTTGKDNQTPSLIRLLALGMGSQFIFLAGWSVIFNKQDFNPEAYGIGSGALLAALGVALRVAFKTSAGNTDAPPAENG